MDARGWQSCNRQKGARSLHAAWCLSTPSLAYVLTVLQCCRLSASECHPSYTTSAPPLLSNTLFPNCNCFLSLPPSYRTKQAEVFQKKGRSLRNKMWWNYCKWKLLIIGAIIILAIVIFLIACFSGGRDCTQQGVRNDFEEGSGTNPPR